ncbi:cuticle protein 7 isoform X1 [Procambarus clarkii]|uniref:cuticle protein 7 isoform X1 n=2 Tax=Procambarus clarkii TaxID=6728 RepID=UPI001E678984|nr:cuticle protein 7-like isoform X1 [Procambarus clarkii]
MIAKVLMMAALVAVTLARPEPPPVYGPPPSYPPPKPAYGAPAYPDTPPQYNSQFAVKDDYSGTDFGHQETRDGYDTQGSYSVLLPDGRLQKVTYYVNGDSGYVAEVTYEGEAQYPAYQPAPAYKPAPAYQPAPAYA